MVRSVSRHPLSPLALLSSKLCAGDYPDLTIRKRKKATPFQHVIVWFLGSVLAGCIPILATVLYGLAVSKPVGFYEALGKGDLLLIALVLSLAGLSDLVLKIHDVRPGPIWPALLVVGTVLLVAGDALWFGDLSSAVLHSGTESPGTGGVAYGSIGVFTLAAVFSTLSVWLAAGAES